MSLKNSIPGHLMPVSALAGPMQVVGEPREKTDENGERKRSKDFDAAGWTLPVEITRGMRKKDLPDGTSVTVMDTQSLNVTVWSDTRPLVSPEMYISLKQPMIGAFNGSLYVQSLGAVPFEPSQDMDLDSLLGDEE